MRAGPVAIVPEETWASQVLYVREVREPDHGYKLSTVGDNSIEVLLAKMIQRNVLIFSISLVEDLDLGQNGMLEGSETKRNRRRIDHPRGQFRGWD